MNYKFIGIIAGSMLILMSCAELKQSGREIGHATRDATRAIGHTTRDVTREIGHGTRDAVKGVGKGIKKATSSESNDQE